MLYLRCFTKSRPKILSKLFVLIATFVGNTWQTTDDDNHHRFTVMMSNTLIETWKKSINRHSLQMVNFIIFCNTLLIKHIVLKRCILFNDGGNEVNKQQKCYRKIQVQSNFAIYTCTKSLSYLALELN